MLPEVIYKQAAIFRRRQLPGLDQNKFVVTPRPHFLIQTEILTQHTTISINDLIVTSLITLSLPYEANSSSPEA